MVYLSKVLTADAEEELSAILAGHGHHGRLGWQDHGRRLGTCNGKSLVWYPKAKFDEAGYKVPETCKTWLHSRSDCHDGDTPWCIGIESGAALLAVTDWIEETMLRTTSPENTTSGWPAN